MRCCLPIPQKLHNVAKRLKTKEEVEQYFPAGFLAFVDCTAEQPIPRPKNRRRRRLYYSYRKKKKHTVKNLYAANQKERIIFKFKHKHTER